MFGHAFHFKSTTIQCFGSINIEGMRYFWRGCIGQCCHHSEELRDNIFRHASTEEGIAPQL